MRAGIDRTAAVVARVIVLTGISVEMLYMQSTERSAVQQDYADSIVADAVVTDNDGVDPAMIERIRALPGVASASEYVQSLGFVEEPLDDSLRGGGIGWILQGMTPDGSEVGAPVTVADGTLDNLRGDAVAVGIAHAAELGVGMGGSITLRMGDNAALDAEVVALFTADDDNDTLLLPAETVAAHTTAGRVTEILVMGMAASELNR